MVVEEERKNARERREMTVKKRKSVGIEKGALLLLLFFRNGSIANREMTLKMSIILTFVIQISKILYHFQTKFKKIIIKFSKKFIHSNHNSNL